ncbi:glycosyltransferase family protein [Galactobacter caseinivorans]|uniref:UDP-N-acetylglucosamine--LPS N-acetylglucosamine transferase n=1 Tax=Galactobacter caseinivorans TaxID=2676123 RepID=A0A496PJI0_9MICC|nr:UDP-N-acetylglucosamine--LPS N-acetylglucosamine transferase [Galactobacter caseinivorans]RKW70654.1 UDP-N-acetylglucosamine--LPS N-acetylglucosamine transferase [Galactobacter caseinivorans]
MKILLVTSPGGHLAHLLALRSWWQGHDRLWVTAQQPDTELALAGERVVWSHWPTTRNIPNAIKNMALAVQVLRAERPDVIVSDGAGVAVPFFAIARAMGITTAYVECCDRVEVPSLTAKLCYPLSDVFCVQWERQKRSFPEANNIGALL